MINFTIGPVQMESETRCIGNNQIPYFRTKEFSELMKENEKILCNLFDAPKDSKVIFMTGSGTASMEGGIMNFFTSKDKVLIINGGSFGERFVRLCEIHEIPFTEIKLPFGNPLTEDALYKFNNQDYTGVVVQLCETSSGVLYDMNLIGKFCNENKCFLLVDAVSGFLADKVSMKESSINAIITGSQKALALPPSMSFTVLDSKAQERCLKNKVKSMYFDYKDYLKNGERGQTPFTPAVGTLLQLYEKLKRIEENGGVAIQNKLIREKATYFRKRILHLPLKMFVPQEYASNCVTALMPTKLGVNAHKIFEIIKDEYNIWVCPNGGEMADKVFRVGHIGAITNEEIDKLIKVFEDLVNREIL